MMTPRHVAGGGDGGFAVVCPLAVAARFAVISASIIGTLEPELEQQAGKAITIRQAMFTAPWYMATVDAETAARTLREAPRPLRIIYALTRRRYARLVERAFGTRP